MRGQDNLEPENFEVIDKVFVFYLAISRRWQVSRKVYPVYAYSIIRVQRQAILKRQNFGRKHDFLIIFLRFLWSGKFILPTSNFLL